MWIATDPDGSVWIFENKPVFEEATQDYCSDYGGIWSLAAYYSGECAVDFDGLIPRPDEDQVEIEIVARRV